MNKSWDSDKGGAAQWIAWLTEVMREALRVTKPGGMALVWSIPRTSHWTGTAIEIAGWEVRDVITHLFGSGFPKSLDIGKAIDKAAGAEREITRIATRSGNSERRAQGEQGSTYGDAWGGFTTKSTPATPEAATWQGYGTALKPAAEFWWLAMKPLDGTFAQNALTWGVAGLNVDGARIPTDELLLCHDGQNKNANTYGGGWNNYELGSGRQYRTGGRWPANLLLDEDAARALDAQSGERGGGFGVRGASTRIYGGGKGLTPATGETVGYGDTGGASRFFYVAKASRAERNAGLEGMEARFAPKGNHEGRDMSNPKNHLGGLQGSEMANHHPTVKPLALMRYLCRLTSTPTGGVVLDPFMGSGTTGVAALQEGRSFVGIEREAEYVEIARRRIAAAELPLLREAAD